MTAAGFGYDNRTGRPPGRVISSLGLVLPGVRRVQAQVAPYADAWWAHNRRVLTSPRHDQRWVVLGDSMAQGVGASAYDRGWVGQLADRLGTVDVVNLSATGARTRDVTDVQVPLLDDVGPFDVVTVLIGSNDLLAGGAVRDALPDAFGEMVDALPTGTVVATLPQPRAAARAANAHLAAAVSGGRLRMVDMRSSGPASWRGKLAADYFHPNDAGYAALADAFEPAVRAVLRDRR